MLFEPLNGLQKGVLLGVLDFAVLGVSSHGETVLDARVQVDLVRHFELFQDIFGLATLLGGENLVGLGGGNGQRAFNVFQFIGLHERRVRRVSDVDLAGVGPQVAHHVFAAEAVSHRTDFLFVSLAFLSPNLTYP